MTSATMVSRPATTGDPRVLAVGAVAAIVLNLVTYAIGSAAGATWIVNGQSITWVMVVLATVVAMAVGGAITYLLTRRWAHAASVMAWVGLAFAVVSAPAPLLSSDDASTGVALAAMHVLTGIVWFVAVRPRPSRSES